MDQAGLAKSAAAALVALLFGGGQAGYAAPSRFMSYDSESDCSAGRILAPSVCRSAFASARSEFEAKTTSFATLGECVKVYGACAAWPPGTRSRASYRPQWGGIDVVDTPSERSVTPSVAGGAKRVRFAARPLGGDEPLRELVVRGGRRPPPSPAPGRPLRAARQGEPDTRAVPGGGFTLQNGVLSYPAPARFAPKALRNPP